MPYKTGDQAVLLGDYGDQFKSYGVAAYRLGQILMLPDGRLFRFGKNGATLAVVGNVYQRALPGANYDELVVQAAAAVGAKSVSITNGVTTITKDQFAEGYLNIEDDAGEGRAYKVVGNEAESAGSATFRVDLAEGIQVALTTATTVGLYASNFDGALITTAAPTDVLVGVAASAIAASSWGWFQFRGPCSVLTQGTLVKGKTVVPSATTAGAVAPPALTEAAPNTGFDQPLIGICLEVAATTEYSLVDLLIP